jgi:DNA repair ATPase RecN
MRVSTLTRKLSLMQDEYNQRKAQQSILEKQKSQLETKIQAERDQKLELEKISALLVKTAESAREAGRQRMEKVVTRALQSIFGPDFSFKIEMDEAGGKPIARFLVCSPGENGELIENEQQDSRGGGINDIVAFALQVAVMVVYNEPKIQGPIVLDEPGKHVSEEYVVKFGEFLDFISKTFNRQIFMVTHQPHLALTADKTLISQMVGGKTVIKESVKDGEEFEWAEESSEEDSDA